MVPLNEEKNERTCLNCHWENLIAELEPCGSCFEFDNWEVKR